jgi:hypothetical protein
MRPRLFVHVRNNAKEGVCDDSTIRDKHSGDCAQWYRWPEEHWPYVPEEWAARREADARTFERKDMIEKVRLQEAKLLKVVGLDDEPDRFVRIIRFNRADLLKKILEEMRKR